MTSIPWGNGVGIIFNLRCTYNPRTKIYFMYDIYLNSESSGVSFKGFQSKMLDICNEHHRNDRALAFAFILYEFENAHLKKILDDDDYWLTLNELSGKYLTVFSLNYKSRRQKYRKPIRRGSSENNDLEYLPIVNTRFNPSISSNKLIDRYFGEIEVRYPSILFFQVDNKNVTDTLLIELNEQTIEQGFIELKTYIQSAVDALKLIDPKYKNNIAEIFDNLEANVRSTKTLMKVRRVTKNAGGLISLISSIESLFR